MKYLVCNFKNKLLKNEIIEYNNSLQEIEGNHKLIIMPPFPFISLFTKNRYNLGAQDISSFIDKTITGEVTGEQIKSLGCNYVLVGHSERRIYKNEINIDFINKINNALENDLNVIYCIGETLQDKENGDTFIVLEKQVSEVLNNVEIKNIIIAYEPIWAIGTGKTPSKEDIIETIDFIKDMIYEKYETKLEVLYGGSVSEKNIAELLKINALDGFLVGGASLDINSVKKMLQEMQK